MAEVSRRTVIQTTFSINDCEATVVIDQGANTIEVLCTLRSAIGEVAKITLTRDETVAVAALFGKINESLMPKIAELNS